MAVQCATLYIGRMAVQCASLCIPRMAVQLVWKLALKSFVAKRTEITVLLRMDNVTAIAFINRMGGTHSEDLSNLAVELWKWCLHRRILVHAEHLPGRKNIRADWGSRHLRDSSNWMLGWEIFLALEEKLGPFTIDLFASRLNAQLPVYCSLRPDPAALAVDALSISWTDQHPYLFPPFALIGKCLQKIPQEEVEALLIAPVWQTQIWYPTLLGMLVERPVLLPNTQNILQGPQGELHPLALQGHLPLAAWCVSGSHTATEDLLKCSTSPVV